MVGQRPLKSSILVRIQVPEFVRRHSSGLCLLVLMRENLGNEND